MPPEREAFPPCPVCGYVANRDHVHCPVCGEAAPVRKAPPAPTRRCACGEEVPAPFRFCIVCGKEVSEEARCPACQGTNPRHHRFCCHCGSALEANTVDL